MSAASRHRLNILKSAIRLFRRYGYAATGLNDILKSSQAPKGSLYHYFPNGKEELGAEAVRAAGKTVTKTLEELMADTSSTDEFLKRYCELLAYWIENSNFQDGCPITTTLLEMSATSPTISQAGAEAFNDWRTVLKAVLTRDGWPAETARQHADFILASIQGAILLSRIDCSTAPLITVSNLTSQTHPGSFRNV